ncbi:stalk domain-containing protein [Armatimonas sp.]|uniref:stalk domain-containing protein n=1 Tax=Armatimonas sp. TaxID=1872638 RepID=UPI00374DCF89
MNIGKSVQLFTAFISSITLVQMTAQAQEITVRVNGNNVPFADTHPQKVEGRVLVPIRGVLENIGADINWNEATQTVKAKMGERDLEIRLGSRTALVNGQTVSLRVPAMRIGGSTMVPLRFISEALGASVEWSEPRQMVSITTRSALSTERPVARNRDRVQDLEPNKDTFVLRINGREEAFGAARPYLRGEDVMVPLEQFSRAAKFNYRFDSAQNTVTVPDKQLKNAVGSRWVDKNGQRIRMESPTEIRRSTLYVPLEFIELASDQTATWNAETHTIAIVNARP